MLNEPVKNFHFHSYANHLSVIIQRQDIFNQIGEDPESEFFVLGLFKKPANDEVHALAITDKGVSFNKGLENVSHTCGYFRPLEKPVILVCKGPTEVQIYLVEMRVGVSLERSQ